MITALVPMFTLIDNTFEGLTGAGIGDSGYFRAQISNEWNRIVWIICFNGLTLPKVISLCSNNRCDYFPSWILAFKGSRRCFLIFLRLL